MAKNSKEEVFKVSGEEIVAKVKKIIEEGNARRVIIETEKGERIMEFPLTVGAVGVLLAPILAAVGALVALAARYTIVVEKRK